MSSAQAPPTMSLPDSNSTRDTPTESSNVKGGRADPEIIEETREEGPQVPEELEKQEPRTSDEQKLTTTKDQPSMGETVVQSAKQYVPEPVGKAVDYAAAAAASYLPDPQGIKGTLSSYLSAGEYPDSMPGAELKDDLPGGTLPGTFPESSVAILPEESQEGTKDPRPATPQQRRDTTRSGAEGVDNERRNSEKEDTITRDAPLSEDVPITSQPSDAAPQRTEASAMEPVASDVSPGSGGDVGSQREISKTTSEQHPSERVEEASVGAIDMAGTAPGATITERGSTGPEKEVSDQDKSLSGVAQEEEKREEGTTVPRASPSGEYHPAQLHPPPPGASVAEYQSSHGTGAQQETQASATTQTGKRGSTGAEKKPGFMTIVKGEMKILAGKMSRDAQKVEEGKKIVHGEA